LSRGDYKFANAPFDFCVTEVDEHNRVRIPPELRAVVSWLKEETGSLDCFGALGPVGGIQIEPLAQYTDPVVRFRNALRDVSPRSTESGRKWVDAARLLATSWKMTVTVEKNQMRITIPEPVRRARQLPGEGGVVAVFGFGEIVEIWEASRWHDYVRTIARNRLSVVESAIEDIGNR
jgi:DNA-binding transcriptional regulator/RsmH inhibitor MraZ